MKDVFEKADAKTELSGDRPSILEAEAAKVATASQDLDLPPKDRKSRLTPVVDGAGVALATGDAVNFVGHPGQFAVVGHDRGEGRILVLTKEDAGLHYFSVPVASVRKVGGR